ncbi:MAG: nucleotidyltransferase domain-containing protein [Lachnospiraceae bacterium]|nr:nucleotidyltransferase domain-containing protein [Lachnospiraceae bacterium]
MSNLTLTNEIILKVKKEAVDSVNKLMGADLVEMILYGSCARVDYHEDSDIDIALITRCGRMEAKKYDDGLDEIAVQLAMKYFAVVNFVCLPYDEFLEKRKSMERHISGIFGPSQSAALY